MKVACIICRKPDKVLMKDWNIPCEDCQKKEDKKKAKELKPMVFKQAVGMDWKISEAHVKDIRSRFYTPEGEVVKGEKGRRINEAIMNDQKRGIKHKWNT